MEIDAFGEIGRLFFDAIEVKARLGAFRKRDDEEIEQKLALRRQKAAEAALARFELLDAVGDQLLQKSCRVRACDFQHAPVGEKTSSACH